MKRELLFFVFDMISPITFLRQTYDELKQVKWPTRQEVIRLTIVVLIMSFAIGIYIGGLDYIFTNLMSIIL